LSETARIYDRFPTDPTPALILLLAVLWASHLTPDQAQALTQTGGIAELALTIALLARERR
jgi:cytochrome c oxidase assembly factor CtaG